MQEIILRNLLDNSEYYRTVLPFLTSKHFQSIEAQELFKAIKDFSTEYGKAPNKKELGLILKNSTSLNDKVKDSVISFYKQVLTDDKVENNDFLLNETEKYVQRVEMTDAILKSADMIQKGESQFERILGFVSDALKIRFDTDVGLNYNESLEHRLEYYHKKNIGLTSGMETIDKILGGGFKPKTLNVLGAPSHVGKSMGLISIASALALKKKKVLFLPLEMSEEEIGKRIDSNILDINSNEIKNIELDVFRQKFNSIKDYLGDMIIKEYPAGVLNTFKLEALLEDLIVNKGFVPDIIVIDYLTLMSSARLTIAQAGGGYAFYKAIAEELHALSKKYNVPVLTAAQLNRSAYGNKEAGLETIADSLGIVQTADVFIAMITDDVLKENGRMYWKFLKNRNTGILKSQMVGIDYTRARFFDVEEDMEAAKTINSGMSLPETVGLDMLSNKGQENSLDFSVLNFK
jgi:replicative DNA helicase